MSVSIAPTIGFKELIFGVIEALDNVFFKGGGPSSPPKQPKVKLPKAPDPLPPPPPPTEYRPDVGQSAMDTRNREAKKRGIGATLLAGETANSGGKRTLLG